MKIEDKVCIVVGGARGIGRAYCEALLAKGAKVVLADIQEDSGVKTVLELTEKCGKGNILFQHCDNTKDDDVKALFETTLGVPDIFIHNAAIINEFDWQHCMDVNVGGLIRSCLEALKHMSVENGGKGGVIVNTASIGGLRAQCWGPVYTASKWASVGFTTSWGLPENLAVTGVRFNCVCPTTVDTEFLKFCRPDRIYHAETVNVDEIRNKLKPAFVAEGMIKLVEDDTLNGKAMRISAEHGHDFAELDPTIQ